MIFYYCPHAQSIFDHMIIIHIQAYLNTAAGFDLQYTTHETGQKTGVACVSPSKPAGQTFLSRTILVRDILSYVDGTWFQRNTRDAPRETFLTKFAWSDTREALSIFVCHVLYVTLLSTLCFINKYSNRTVGENSWENITLCDRTVCDVAEELIPNS